MKKFNGKKLKILVNAYFNVEFKIEVKLKD